MTRRRLLEIYWSYFSLLTPGARIFWLSFDLIYYVTFAVAAAMVGRERALLALMACGMGRAMCLAVLPDGSRVLHRRNDRQFLRQVFISRCYDGAGLEPGGTVLDVGGQIGLFTVLAARRVGPEGRVIVLEPEPSNHALLLRNVALNRLHNVIVIRKAASSGPGVRSLSLSPVNPGIHSLSFRVGDRAIEVETVTLDQLAKEAGLAEVSLLKVDVEGEELEVLKGAATLLPLTRHVVLEVDGGDREFQAVAQYLSHFGFEARITDWRIVRATRILAKG
jgi:FkbM family methyltransferase